jgi:hypothetical protein
MMMINDDVEDNDDNGVVDDDDNVDELVIRQMCSCRPPTPLPARTAVTLGSVFGSNG